MDLLQYLNDTKGQMIRDVITCKDGFKISIQASMGHYCSPRRNGATYTTVELGYPSSPEPLIKKYAEETHDLTNTVYGFVPVDVVQQVLDKHNGIIAIKEEQNLIG